MMKKLFLLISLILCLSFPATAENWKEIKTMPDGSATYYVDTDRLTVEENVATAWVKLKTKKGYTVVSQMEFHRKPRTFDLLYFQSYKPNGDVAMEQQAEERNKFIPPETAAAEIYKFLWPVNKENWLLINSYGDGKMNLYIDTDSIDINGDTATVWQKMTARNGYMLSIEEFHKDSRTTSGSYSILFNNENQIVRVSYNPPYLRKIYSGSSYEKIYDLIWPKA